jgi:hypothetical protein
MVSVSTPAAPIQTRFFSIYENIYNRQESFALAAELGHFGPFDKAFFFAEKSFRDPIKINPGNIKV